MAKIVYNACHGGFGLSKAAMARYAEIKGLNDSEREALDDWDIPRDDKALVQVVEEMREAANGYCASLEIAELTAGVLYQIDEYDGYETVMTIDDYKWHTARD